MPAPAAPASVDVSDMSRKSSKADPIKWIDPSASTPNANSIQQHSQPSYSPQPSKSLSQATAQEDSKKVVSETEGSPLEALHILKAPIPVYGSNQAVLIGLSGVTSSGKTTIAHLLTLILPSTSPIFLVHQDDFFVPKRLLVPLATGDLDADCWDAVDFAAFEKMLMYAKREGSLPKTFHTMQEEAAERRLALSKINQGVIDELKALVTKSEVFEVGRPIGIVDGFLLYGNRDIRNMLDVKILLRASREKARERRFKRPEYTGSEVGGSFFWRTRDYFDRKVWPNYSRENGPLFEQGNVLGRPFKDVCEGLQISIQPELDQSIEDTLRWVIENIIITLRDLKAQVNQNIELDTRSSQVYGIYDDQVGWIEKCRRILFDLL